MMAFNLLNQKVCFSVISLRVCWAKLHEDAVESSLSVKSFYGFPTLLPESSVLIRNPFQAILLVVLAYRPSPLASEAPSVA
jgi:hypothetical protein